MKRWIIFIAIYWLTKLPALACGPYYPYGDDVRFRLLYPEAFHYDDFCNFHFTAGFTYYPRNGSEAQRDSQLSADYRAGIRQNVLLWKSYCKDQVDEASIETAVYDLAPSELRDKKSSNKLVRYLQVKDTAALHYLYFAKMCENGNAFYSDPWERQSAQQVPDYARRFLREAIEGSNRKGLDTNLRLRYAFLGIRLAFYQQDSTSLCRLYEQHFAKRDKKQILDYWSLYFRLTFEPDSVKRNYDAAMVFSNAPDKRVPVYNFFRQKMAVEPVLALAHNKQERAAIWLTKGIQEPGRAMDALKGVYDNDPASRGFGVLLLRELNKLEDWIYTPYYTCFYPSVIPGGEPYDSWGHQNESYPANRITQDRRYAAALLEFLRTVPAKQLSDPQLYYTARAYLCYMTGDDAAALEELDRPELKRGTGTTLREELQQLDALCRTAMQKDGEAVIAAATKPVLMQAARQYNYRFLFAVARELEYKGNTTDAGLLFSKINEVTIDAYNEDNSWNNVVSWRARKGYNTLWLDFYTDYIFYLDAAYTPEQLHGLIRAIETRQAKDSFSNWLYASITPKRERLYDLLGTKYIRQDKLDAALGAFRKVSDKVWNDSAYYFWQCLAANPFYTNMYQEHQVSAADSVRLTKTQITEQLIRHLQLAADPKRRNRDYHYFIAANCYLNMTQYGNSWMMRRYYWTSDANDTKLEDDKEYFECGLAKQYYLKAKELSHSKRFAALCLRMAGRCEKYRLLHLETEKELRDNDYQHADETVFRNNKLYRQLQKEYPDYYEDLMSNCTAFERYFAARR